MNKYEDIIKALRCCASESVSCPICPNWHSDNELGACKENVYILAADALAEMCDKVIELTAERDALLKSFTVTSQPIEVIQPKGVVE